MDAIRLDVYGTPMVAERESSGWKLFRVGLNGKRSLVDVPIPDFVTEAGLAQFLDDLFHEAATPAHPCVTRKG